MTDSPQDRLAALGLSLPKAAAPVATYVPVARTGSLLVVSGQLPLTGGTLKATGKLGEDVSPELGRACAELCFLNILAQLEATLGDLSPVVRIVRLGGFIACTSDFTQHATVMNGASDLAVAVFGEAGRHARSTIGVPSLPLDAPVEIEALVEIA
ncbi:RidA family protein [Swaminathania salitolerans]|uniref:Endoribonuclease L-PSP/chorismate mutase-like domain-containing protein n=1 Tax=Swaminathania salitolerans TaxID=182838 RepID=A0A511BRR1_9PROT|nr:RidA family protein [Swaminathania salitolerans]GBQ12280.1 translation initiation inhibitor YjgF [Swaminathania salitolerans LMG 21291]GEL02792.1 hypothetical protein SSA02_19550 [Swaminathania salitolerans]